MYDLIIFFIVNILSLYNSICLFDILFLRNSNRRRWLATVIYIIYLIIGIITFLISDKNPLLNLFINIIILYLLTFLYEAKIMQKVFGVLFYLSLMVGFELFVPYIYSFIVKRPVQEVLSHNSNILFMMPLSRLIPLTLFKVYQLSHKGERTHKGLNIADIIKIIIIPICSIVVMHSLYSVQQLQNNKMSFLIALSIALMMSINIIFYYLYDNLLDTERARFENNLLTKQIEYYTKKYEELENNMEELHTLKHDLKHKLTFIRTKVRDNEENAIEIIENELMLAIDVIEMKEIMPYTNNSYLNMLLNYKINSTSKQKIEFDIKVGIGNGSIADEKILSIILGNAFDNAVESFDPSKSSLNKIIIRLYAEKGNLYIKISNPYAHEIVFHDNLPITNKKDKIRHGIGLKSIEKLVGDYGGFMKISCAENVFSLEIILFDAIKGE